MPEGDSLHRAAARLQVLVGERVEAVAPHPRGAATGVAAIVDGRVLESVEAVGKHLLLHFEGGVTLRSHLRMKGRWRVERRGARRVGLPWLVLGGREWEGVQWNGPVLTLDTAPVARIGPDLLAEATRVSAVVARLRSADDRRLLGEVLLDQRLVAGIGNLWMAEALWQARISPWLPLGEASDEDLLAALERARESMLSSARGAAPRRRFVYRRAGRPCPRCSAPIRSRGLGDANRTAYWCDTCQRGPSPPLTGRRPGLSDGST
jgi:endonuclease VIII